MKLHLTHGAGLYLVSSLGDGYVAINGHSHGTSLVVTPSHPPTPWPVDGFDQLTAHHFAELVKLGPELVLLGTGSLQRFPHPSLYADLIRAGIGIEIMTTAAACRTYNILASEGRMVVAALIVGAGA